MSPSSFRRHLPRRGPSGPGPRRSGAALARVVPSTARSDTTEAVFPATEAVRVRNTRTQVHTSVIRIRRTGGIRRIFYVRERTFCALTSSPTATPGSSHHCPGLRNAGHQAPAHLRVELVQTRRPVFVYVRYRHYHGVRWRAAGGGRPSPCIRSSPLVSPWTSSAATRS